MIKSHAGICIPSLLVWQKLIHNSLCHGGEAKLGAPTKVLFLKWAMESLKSIVGVHTNAPVAMSPFLEKKIRLNIFTHVYKEYNAL